MILNDFGGYATMTIEELFALPVPQWAAEQCHLYFCMPNNFMPLACKAVEHYGFQHRNIITWKKPHWGRGHHFRNITERVIFATRGDPLREAADKIASAITKAGKSGKPVRLRGDA